MEILSSRQNRIIVHMRKLGADRAYRRQNGEYVCDGAKLLGEAVKWGAEIGCVLMSKDVGVELPAGTACYSVSQELLDYVSPLKNCPGVIFSVRMPKWETSDPGKVIVCETLQDPGNVGTVMRTANALNMDTVILTGECADIYNPKTVRAAMGATFRQRVLEMGRSETRQYLTDNGLKLYGAALSDRSEDIRNVSMDSLAIAIGSEGKGLSPEMLSMCDGELIIPMNSACESLNAAIAAAIVMWELTRQGRN